MSLLMAVRPLASNIPAPYEILEGVEGCYYDPYYPLNRTETDGAGAVNLGTTVTDLNDPIALIYALGPNSGLVNLTQANNSIRGTLRSKEGWKGFGFNGIDQHLFNSDDSEAIDFRSLPKTLTVFGRFNQDTILGSGEECIPLAFNRASTSQSYLRPMLAWASVGYSTSMRFNANPGSFVNFNSAVLLYNGDLQINKWYDYFWEITITSAVIAGTGTGAGNIKGWLNGNLLVNLAITPAAAGLNAMQLNRTVIGGRMQTNVTGALFPGLVGRCGRIGKALNDLERNKLRRWMLGTAYVAA